MVTTTENRAEHLSRCKKRAIAYLDNPNEKAGVINAWSSIASDLNKHPETEGHVAILLGGMRMTIGTLSTKAQMAEFIDGIN